MNRMLLARALWVAAAVLAASLSIAGIPARFHVLQTVCTGGSCGQFGAPLTPPMALTLHHLGLTLALYAGYTMALEVMTSLVSVLLGALLFWRARTVGTLFAASVLVTFGALSTNLPDALARAHPAMFTPVALLDGLALSALAVFLYVFPNGRFVPGWTRIPAAVAVVFFAIVFLYPQGLLQPMNNPPSLVGEVVLLLIGVAAQVYRYRDVSGTVERQQTKWVVFGVAVAFSVNAGLLVLSLVLPASNPLIAMAQDTLFSLCGLLMPITIAIAVLHHRLYDIDALANRTLVYGSLTVSLAAFYLGSVVVLQALFRAVTGQRSDLAIAIATLLLAALFNPWRRRLQAFIDRRFYRRKYDATRILAGFSTRLRDEVDLRRLERDILTVVVETMQPERAAFWLPEETRP
jgi:hypothetical protein